MLTSGAGDSADVEAGGGASAGAVGGGISAVEETTTPVEPEEVEVQAVHLPEVPVSRLPNAVPTIMGALIGESSSIAERGDAAPELSWPLDAVALQPAAPARDAPSWPAELVAVHATVEVCAAEPPDPAQLARPTPTGDDEAAPPIVLCSAVVSDEAVAPVLPRTDGDWERPLLAVAALAGLWGDTWRRVNLVDDGPEGYETCSDHDREKC